MKLALAVNFSKSRHTAAVFSNGGLDIPCEMIDVQGDEINSGETGRQGPVGAGHSMVVLVVWAILMINGNQYYYNCSVFYMNQATINSVFF